MNLEKSSTTSWSTEHDSLSGAQALDLADPISKVRQEFYFPHTQGKDAPLYFAGHSLGLMPKAASERINEDLQAWGQWGVEGHFLGDRPWLPYHENLTPLLARLLGAKPTEVVAMNSLTVNLHLALVSFYRPKGKRNKILIEQGTFPSDKYAVDSQARFHGLDPNETILQARPRAGELILRTDDLLQQIEDHKDDLALILLGQCNYLTGQAFEISRVVEVANRFDIPVGLNLAHGAGNLHLGLHNSGVDFAVWCSYKYLNSGPGGIAGLFIHERHHAALGNVSPAQRLPRFEGWWGHNKSSRFKMGPDFDPIPSVEAWQLSNPPIWQLSSHLASLEIFDRVGSAALRERGDRMTSYFEWLLTKKLSDRLTVVTPALPHRGSMLCLRFHNSPREIMKELSHRAVFVDFREPDIVRATPAPLYNSYEDIFRLVQLIDEVSGKSK
jgi:kynureninase